MQHKRKSYQSHHDRDANVNPDWVVIREVNEVVGPDVGVTQLVVRVGAENLVFEGTSRRNTVDPPNDEIGALLAHGRAFEKMSKHLLKRAEGLSKHYDDCREMRKARLEQLAEQEKAEQKKAKKKAAKKTSKGK